MSMRARSYECLYVRARMRSHACVKTSTSTRHIPHTTHTHARRVTYPTHTHTHTHDTPHHTHMTRHIPQLTTRTHVWVCTHANTRTRTDTSTYTLSLSLSLSLTHTHTHTLTQVYAEMADKSAMVGALQQVFVVYRITRREWTDCLRPTTAACRCKSAIPGALGLY